MITVYIACGEVFDCRADALLVETKAFEAWLDNDEMAKAIKDSNARNNVAEGVLRNYWDQCINFDPSVNSVKVVSSGGMGDGRFWPPNSE